MKGWRIWIRGGLSYGGGEMQSRGVSPAMRVRERTLACLSEGALWEDRLMIWIEILI